MENVSLITSSSDIPLEKSLIFPALEIFEGLNKFSRTLRLSNFTFELFCIALESNDSINLLSECHKSLLRCIMRDNDKNNVTFSEHKDCKDTLCIFLTCVDHLTFFEVLNIYFKAIRKQLPHETNEKLKEIFVKQVYSELSAKERIFLLKLLLDAFITSDLVREELDKEEVTVHEDHCRACHKRGDLLCCESCSATFHHYCLEPPLSKFPEGDWFCIACTMHQELARKQKNKLPNKDKVANGMDNGQSKLGIDAEFRTYWFIESRVFVERNAELEAYYSTEEKLDDLIKYLQHDQNNRALVNQLQQRHSEITKSMSLLAERMTEIQSYVMTEGGLEEYLDNAYCNVYTEEILALSKQQQIEEKERKRYLSYKFSMVGFNDFSWISDANKDNFLSKIKDMSEEVCGSRLEQCRDGGLDSTIKMLQNTIIHLKDCIPKAFFHANWMQHSERWSKAVRLCTKAREFSLALLIFNSSMKPFIFHDAWIKATGHLDLEMRSMEEREEDKRMEQELKSLLKEELNSHSIMKNPIGFRHQLWKQRGEEYRMLGRYAWMWLAPTRRSQCGASRFKKSFIFNSINNNNKNNSNGNTNINGDIDTELAKSNIKSKACTFMEGLLEKAAELNNELAKKKRDIEIKLVLLKNLNGVCTNLFEEGEDLKDKSLKVDENSDLIKASNENNKIKLDDIYCSFTSFLNHLERFQKSDKNNAQKKNLKQKMLAAEHSLKQCNKLKPDFLGHSVNLGKYLNALKVNESIKQGGLPKSHKFQIGRHKKLMSVYVLDRKKKKKLSRKGGGVEVTGYVYNQQNFCAYKHLLQNWKIQPTSTLKEKTESTASISEENGKKMIDTSKTTPQTVFSLSSTPRLTLANSWTYKLTKGVTLSGLAMLVRVMWASIRWEDMYQEYPPMGLLQTEDAIENTTTTCKLIKRRILTPKFDPVNYKVEYLVQKNTKLNDTENSSSNSYGTGRQGLRERKVHEAVICKEWMPEEMLELWQIRYFNSVWERQNNAKLPYSSLTSNNTSQINTQNSTSKLNNTSLSDERSDKIIGKHTSHMVSNTPQDTSIISPSSECPSSPPPLSPPAPLVYPLLTSALSSSSSSLLDPLKDSQFNSILSNNRGTYYSRKRGSLSRQSTEIQAKKAKPQIDSVIKVENREITFDASKPSDVHNESITKSIINNHKSQGNKAVKIYNRSGSHIHALCLKEGVSSLNASYNSLAVKSYKTNKFKSKCKYLVSVFSNTSGSFDVNYLSHLLVNFCKSNSIFLDLNFNTPDGISLTIKANENVSFKGSDTDEITLDFNKCMFNERIYKTFLKCESIKNFSSRQIKKQQLSIKYGESTGPSTYIPQKNNHQSKNSNHTFHLPKTSNETLNQSSKHISTKKEFNSKNNLKNNQQETLVSIEDNAVSNDDSTVLNGKAMNRGKPKKRKHNSNLKLQSSNETHKKEASLHCNGYHKAEIKDDEYNETNDSFNDNNKNNRETLKDVLEVKDKEKLYCICNTPYDATKFYVGCSVCERWMHGACVNLTPEEACKIDVYVCDKCQKDKEAMEDEVDNQSEVPGEAFENGDEYDFIENEEKKYGVENKDEEVYCVCLTPYDQTRFYIGCDGCQGWFHGECMHISADDASKLTSFYCPSCR